MISPKDLPLYRKLKKNGIVNPLWTLQAARDAKLPIAIACAILDQESGGGHNVWGHDPTIFVGGYDAHNHNNWGSQVTKAAYLEYKKQRGPRGTGGMQGVGPCQLTYYSFQDAADAHGGCWTPKANMTVGFKYVADNIRRYGLRDGIRAYNGSGPAAENYATHVLARIDVWRGRLA